jgi:site-specific recombinase XerD
VKHDRKKETLNLYLIASPRTPIERQSNKEVLELAKEIRVEREQQLKADRTGKRIKSNLQKVNFFDFFQTYIDNYTKKDIRHIKRALVQFKMYLYDAYPIYKTSIKPEQIDKEMVAGFLEFLQSKFKGEGAHTLFQRFKKVIKYAVSKDLIVKNPCEGIVCKVDDQTLKKDVLSTDEVVKLIGTNYQGQSPEIRRAFIFCLYTGIRFCDVIDLKYKNVDYSNRLLQFEQEKTKGHSKASGVVIPLNDGLLSLIGKSSTGNGEENIFRLPSHTMCLKALRHWTKRAGITKHITWHCARHSFAVNILNNGANIKTVASLLGHSGLKHTEKYTRAVDSLKEAAINSLPELRF